MKQMNIAIIGYGRMGQMIESIAMARGHEIGSTIDIGDDHLMDTENLIKHDVAIEFTGPDTAFENISRCLEAGLPVVSGSTGWTDRLDELISKCTKEKGSFLYASNFSLGVNILFHVNRLLAGIMNKHNQYDVDMTEVHHTRKLDAPSGTAISLAEDILKEVNRKNNWTIGDDEALELLKIKSVREGEVPGIHEVHYESEYDELSLRHSAKDRRGFAMGAVIAAEFLKDKLGFYTMEDLLQLQAGRK
jgi:4-hydroxy-tetrahydrodipicolinate reductase